MSSRVCCARALASGRPRCMHVPRGVGGTAGYALSVLTPGPLGRPPSYCPLHPHLAAQRSSRSARSSRSCHASTVLIDSTQPRTRPPDRLWSSAAAPFHTRPSWGFVAPGQGRRLAPPSPSSMAPCSGLACPADCGCRPRCRPAQTWLGFCRPSGQGRLVRRRRPRRWHPIPVSPVRPSMIVGYVVVSRTPG